LPSNKLFLLYCWHRCIHVSALPCCTLILCESHFQFLSTLLGCNPVHLKRWVLNSIILVEVFGITMGSLHLIPDKRIFSSVPPAQKEIKLALSRPRVICFHKTYNYYTWGRSVLYIMLLSIKVLNDDFLLFLLHWTCGHEGWLRKTNGWNCFILHCFS
jgi:hypothetical protein